MRNKKQHNYTNLIAKKVSYLPSISGYIISRVFKKLPIRGQFLEDLLRLFSNSSYPSSS